MKPRLPQILFRLLLLAGLCLVQFAPPLSTTTFAAPVKAAIATITYADGHTVTIWSARERFRAIPISAGETVTLDVQLPPKLANTPAFAQALDGGLVSAVVIGADGAASVSFQAGNQPGRYRLLLGARGRTAIVQFDVPRQP